MDYVPKKASQPLAKHYLDITCIQFIKGGISSVLLESLECILG